MTQTDSGGVNGGIGGTVEEPVVVDRLDVARVVAALRSKSALICVCLALVASSVCLRH